MQRQCCVPRRACCNTLLSSQPAPRHKVDGHFTVPSQFHCIVYISTAGDSGVSDLNVRLSDVRIHTSRCNKLQSVHVLMSCLGGLFLFDAIVTRIQPDFLQCAPEISTGTRYPACSSGRWHHCLPGLRHSPFWNHAQLSKEPWRCSLSCFHTVIYLLPSADGDS